MTDAEHGNMGFAQEQKNKSDSAFTKLQKAIYTLLLTIFFAAAATLIMWALEPAPYRDYERELLTKEVYPGGLVKLSVKVEWTKTCYSRLRRNIVFSNDVLVPYEREIRLNKEGYREFVITQQLPLDAPPGLTKWVVITDWFCNPLQFFWPRTINLEPLEFTVLPLKGSSHEGELQEMSKAYAGVGRRL